MNAPHKLPRGAGSPNKQPAHLSTTEWHACDDCSGFGHFRSVIQVAGEWLDGDFGETLCENCDGEGGWEACSWCGKAQGCRCYRIQQVYEGEEGIARASAVYRADAAIARKAR